MRVLSWHYQKVMGHNLDQLKAAFDQKCERMLEYSLLKKLINHIPKEKDDQCLQLLRALTTHFKESLESIVTILPDLTHLQNIPTISPCIVLCEGDKKYYVTIEKTITTDNGFHTLMNAICYFYGVFFVFNMKYPNRANCTMETVQMYFMKTNPNSGTKSTKIRSKSSVIRFIKAFSNFIVERK